MYGPYISPTVDGFRNPTITTWDVKKGDKLWFAPSTVWANWKLDTPPEKWTCPLKNSGWKMIYFLLKWFPLLGFHSSNCPGNVMFSQVPRIDPVTLRCLSSAGRGFWEVHNVRTHGCVVYTVYILKWFFPTTTSLTGWKISIFIRKNTSSNGWFAIIS